RTVRGFARNRTGFEIVVQDLKGGFHPLSLDKVARVTEEKVSLMPALKASADELQNLVAFLGGLTGVKLGVAAHATETPGGIDFARILNPKPGDWPTYNGSVSGNRHSSLDQIN